jgi:hypothetical protein
MSIQLGLPKGILPTPEIAMSAGCVSQLVRIQPNNVNSISSSAQALPTAATTYVNNLVFPSQLVQFSIPCGQGKHVWVDSEKSSISFRVNYAVTTAGVATTAAKGFLQDAASSWFSRIVHIGPNGQTIDDVVNLHISELIDHQLNYNTTDRDNFAAQFGFLSEGGSSSTSYNYNLTQGHSIDTMTGTAPTTVSNCYYSYEFPLASALLGKYAKGFFPAGSVNKLDVQMYTNSQVPISYYSGSATSTTAPQMTFTIDNISLNLWYLTLDNESARMLGSPKIHYLHGITCRTANSTIPSGTSGYVNTLIGLRGKSCRQLFTRFTDTGSTSTSNQVNGVFDSKMPLVSQMNYLLQGKDRYPQFPHNTQILPSSVLNRTLMSSEKFVEWEQRSSFIPSQFFNYITNGGSITAANGYDQNLVNAGSGCVINNLATFLFGEDLRKAHNSEVLDGYDLTVTANHFLETNLLVAPSNTQSVFFTGKFDIIFEIDMEAGTVNYRM